MSHIIIIIVLCLIGSFILVAYWINHILSRPRFVWNHCGGIAAMCPYADFKKGLAQRPPGMKLVTVPRTIVLGDGTYSPEASSGKLTWVYDEPYFPELSWPVVRMNNLFVPFNSEGVMSFDEQRKFFIGPQNIEKFVSENLSPSTRIALLLEKKYGVTGLTQLALGLFTIVLIIFTLSSILSSKKTGNGDGTVYVTQGEKVNVLPAEDTVTAGASDMVKEELHRGTVVTIVPISTDIVRACIITSGDKQMTWCGFSTPHSVKIGSEMLSRSEQFLAWRNATNASHYNFERILITPKEAEALVTTGKYSIVD